MIWTIIFYFLFNIIFAHMSVYQSIEHGESKRTIIGTSLLYTFLGLFVLMGISIYGLFYHAWKGGGFFSGYIYDKINKNKTKQ